jgi:hypothetical protein
MKCLGMFLLLAVYSKFSRMLMEAPFDSSVVRAAYKRHTQSQQIQITYMSTTQQWCSHQWPWRTSHKLEMVLTVSAYMATFTIWSDLYSPLYPNKYSKPASFQPPLSQSWWLLDITAAQHVWKSVKEAGFNYFQTQNLNQDPSVSTHSELFVYPAVPMIT